MVVRASSFVRLVTLGVAVLAACVLTTLTASVVEAQGTTAKPPSEFKPVQPPAKPAPAPAANPTAQDPAKPGAKPDAAPGAKVTLESMAGTWDGVAQTPNGDLPVHGVLTFQDGKITGTIETAMGVLAITSATLKEDVFELLFDLQGSAGSLSGKVAGEKYEGSWTFGADSGPFAMARVPPPAAIKK